MIIQYYGVEMITSDLSQVSLEFSLKITPKTVHEGPKMAKLRTPSVFNIQSRIFASAVISSHLRSSHPRWFLRTCGLRIRGDFFAPADFAPAMTVFAPMVIFFAPAVPGQPMHFRFCESFLASANSHLRPFFAQVRSHQQRSCFSSSSKSKFDPLSIRNSPETLGTPFEHTNKFHNITRTYSRPQIISNNTKTTNRTSNQNIWILNFQILYLVPKHLKSIRKDFKFCTQVINDITKVFKFSE